MSEYKVEVNGKNLAGQNASFFLQVFAGLKVTQIAGVETLTNATRTERLNALAKIAGMGAFSAMCEKYPESPVIVRVENEAEYKTSLKNLFATMENRIRQLDLAEQAKQARIEAEKYYEEVTLKEVAQRGRKANGINTESLLTELDSILS